MSNRREFIKKASGIGLASIGAGTLTACSVLEGEKSVSTNAGLNLPNGIVFTRENPGMWAKKVGGHAPVVTVNGTKIKIETQHGMSKKHFIVRHTIVTPNGEVIASKTFSPDDLEAVSEYEITTNHKTLYATSFCNKHDMWVEKFSV
ncbi:MAG: desulfoferrodoxin [Gammaproteobacteria bacterium]|nr:desulfoferrodoxin [Gammaproteobacteria bacterium]